MDSAKVYIVVPAFQEASNIAPVITGLLAEGWSNVVVVDDGSSDATAVLAAQAGAQVLRHSVNRGQGATLATGTQWARKRGAEIVVHFDGDNQFNPKDIFPAIALLEQKNFDVILGSRFLDSRSHLPWSKRRIILPISRWINFVFTGLKLTDAHNGFRVLGPRALTAIVITYDGMAHNSEIVAQIKRHGLRFAEYPSAVRYTEFGQGLRGGFKILWDLLWRDVSG